MPTFSKRTMLVFRCRNSHDVYIGLQTNFGIKGHWQFIKSLQPNIAMRQLAVMAPASYFREIFQLAGHDSHLSFLRHALFGGWSEISIPGPHRPLCQMRSQLASGARSRG